jgi:GNAT superfamily N-acetyltransferase
MLDLADIAALEEARLALSLSEVADDWRPVGGGRACRSSPGAWVNVAANVGLSGPVERSELSAITDWYISIGAEPRFELSPYADPTVVQGLSELGYVIRVFESVFYRELSEGSIAALHAPPDGLEITRLDPEDRALSRRYAEVIVPQFYPPGAAPTEADLALVERTIRHPRSVILAAWMDGALVGGGGMETLGEVAALYGLAVVPEYRRRGIQQALIAERLKLARHLGAKVATISSRPRVATERNVRRMGFQVAYTKAVVVRPGEGLAPVIG